MVNIGQLQLNWIQFNSIDLHLRITSNNHKKVASTFRRKTSVYSVETNRGMTSDMLNQKHLYSINMLASPTLIRRLYLMTIYERDKTI